MPTAIIDEAGAWFSFLRRQGRSEKTVVTYAAALKNLGVFLGNRCQDRVNAVTSTDLELWRRDLMSRCQPQTVEVFIRAVRLWFGWLVDQGVLFISPAAELCAVRVPRPMGHVPSEGDMQRLLESIAGAGPVALRDRALLEIAYATGARLAELASLSIVSVDLAGKSLRIVGKGRQERVVPLTTVACECVQRYLEQSRPKLLRSAKDDGFLWLGIRDSRPIGTPAIDAVITHRAAEIGLKMTIHSVRRAFATHLLRGGAHPLELMELLGHRSLRHLRHYLRLAAADVRDCHANSVVGQ